MLDRRRFTALSLAAAGLPLIRPAAARAERPDEEYFNWSKLGESVHFAEGGGGNALYIPAKGGAILVDTKNPGLGDALMREAHSRGPSVGLTINTHHHGDHTGGNDAFTGRSRVAAHQNGLPRVESQRERYINGLRSVVQQAPTERIRIEAQARLEKIEALHGAWTPSMPIENKQSTLREGGREITAHHVTNGHTDNDLIIVLEDENIIHFGDLIFNGLHPFCDANGGVSIEGWIRCLKFGLELTDKDTLVVPGHGPVTDRSGVQTQIDYFEKLIDAVQQQIDAGKSRDETTQMTFPFMEGLGFARIRPIAIGVAYDQLAG